MLFALKTVVGFCGRPRNILQFLFAFNLETVVYISKFLFMKTGNVVITSLPYLIEIPCLKFYPHNAEKITK